MLNVSSLNRRRSAGKAIAQPFAAYACRRRVSSPVLVPNRRMRLTSILLVSFGLACRTAPSSARPYSGSTALAFVGVTIVNPDSGHAAWPATVIIRGNRIVSIEREGGPIPRGAQLIPARGKFLIPGLWDMHVHTLTFPESALTLSARAATFYFPQYLAAGVTGIRDMGAWGDTLVAVRRALAAGTIVGPRIVAAGRLVAGRNPWGPASPHVWILESPDSARFVVDSLRRSGADFIKVHDMLSRAVYFAVARAAREAGMPLAGHLRPVVTVREAVDSGQRGFEHLPIELVAACGPGDERKAAGDFYDRWIAGRWGAFAAVTASMWAARDTTRCSAMMAMLRDAGVRVTPTLILRMQDSAMASRIAPGTLTPAATHFCAQTIGDWGAQPDSVRDLYYRTARDIVGTLHRAGVIILAGTDGPGSCLVPGQSLHDELANFVAAGFTPLEALRAATLEPARYLGLADSLGTVAVGNVADLVLLDADPALDIANARRVVGTVSDGRWLPKAR